MYVWGVLATQLTSEPPTMEECEEFQRLLLSCQWDDETARFNWHLQSKAVLQLTGKGDSHEFALWRNSLSRLLRSILRGERRLPGVIGSGYLRGERPKLVVGPHVEATTHSPVPRATARVGED